MKLKILVSIIILITLTACQQSSTSLIQKAAGQIDISPTQAAVVGQVSSSKTGEPLVDTVVWLAKVYWNEDRSDGAYVLDGAASPSTITDENGLFDITEVKPAEYVIVVGDFFGENVIILQPDGEKVQIYELEAGKVLQVESLIVDLPK